MPKNFQEPEEDSTIIDNENYSPLDTPINEKPYTKANVRMSEADMMNDIPEPKFQPPPIDLTSKPNVEEPKKPPIEPMNSEMKDMPKKEQAKSQPVNLSYWSIGASYFHLASDEPIILCLESRRYTRSQSFHHFLTRSNKRLQYHNLVCTLINCVDCE